MLTSRLKPGRALILAGLIGLSLSACGRRGPLEPPPTTASRALDLSDRETGADEQQSADDAQQVQIGAGPLGKPLKATREVKVPEKPFVLDPIL